MAQAITTDEKPFLDAEALLKPDHLAWLKRRIADQVAEQPRLKDLAEKLESVAGGILCPVFEEDLDELLARGIAFYCFDRTPKIMLGAPSECHSNSARLWEANRTISRICTGYGLSSDGIWRQHSWVAKKVRHGSRRNFDAKNPGHWQVIETTEARLCYFGFVLTPEECDRFAFDNL